MGEIIEHGPRSEMRFADAVTRMSFVAYVLDVAQTPLPTDTVALKCGIWGEMIGGIFYLPEREHRAVFSVILFFKRYSICIVNERHVRGLPAICRNEPLVAGETPQN
jgi:hypothetical protein